MGELTVTKVETVEGFEALEPVWNGLVAAGDHPNTFLTFEWLFSWWETFGSLHRLYILVVRESDEVVGLAPLMLTGRNGRGGRVQFIGTPESDYCDFLSKNGCDVTGAVLDYLMDHRGDWSRIDLEQMSERSTTVERIGKYFKSRPAAYKFQPEETCHSFHYDGDEGARKEFAPRRNKTLKWSINFFKRSGSFSLTELTTSDEIRPWLDYLFHYHMMRWRHTITPSKFADHCHRRFYQTLADRLAAKDGMSLLLLSHDEQPLAFQFNFRFRSAVFVYTLAHNVYYRRQSPGKILNHLATQYYVHAGYDELDFTRGGEAYKGRLTNQTFANYHLRVYHSRTRRWLALMYGRLKSTRPVHALAHSVGLSRLKARLIAAYNDRGVGGMLATAVERAWRRFLDFRTVTTLKHKGAPREAPDPPATATFERVGKDRLVFIASLYGVAEDSPRGRDFAYRFDIGQDCFAASVAGRTVCAVWGCRHEFRLPEAGLTLLGEREVMLTDAFASPSFDDETLPASLLSYAVEYYRQKEYTVMVTDSSASYLKRNVLWQVGFTAASSKTYVRLLGARIA